jgi:hypothetical protein
MMKQYYVLQNIKHTAGAKDQFQKQVKTADIVS